MNLQVFEFFEYTTVSYAIIKMIRRTKNEKIFGYVTKGRIYVSEEIYRAYILPVWRKATRKKGTYREKLVFLKR